MFEHFCTRITALSLSFFWSYFNHSFKLAHVSLVRGPGNTSDYLCTVLPSFFCAFSSWTNWTVVYFLSSYWPPHPAFHPSFFQLNLSLGDLGRAHLLSSLSTPIPSETSEAPFLSQNSPVSSLPALSITQTSSFSFPSVFFSFSLCCGLSLLSSIPIMAEPFFIFPIIFPPDLFQPRGKPPSFPVNNTSSLMLPLIETNHCQCCKAINK